MSITSPRLILASQSPRRRELLERAGFDFDVCTSSCDEESLKTCNYPSPSDMALALARAKAETVLLTPAGHPGSDRASQDGGTGSTAPVVVGADTVVVIDAEVLGKPRDDDEAAQMLQMLSGRTHEVISAVCLCQKDCPSEVFHQTTRVSFYELSPSEIQAYVATGEPRDKAGAYGIQGYGVRLVERIQGDYFTVVGLPVGGLIRRLQARGITPRYMDR